MTDADNNRAGGALAETNGDASLVVRVCTAYEHGFGQYGRALENPYKALTPESEAWNIGWQEARKRTAEKTGGEQP